MMKIIVGGLAAALITFIVLLVYNIIKAVKDPDVQAAADLRMSITRYRKYERLYNEYSEFMKEHGIHSAASEKKFREIFKQIDNPNEWRKYQNFRLHKQKEETLKEFQSITGNDGDNYQIDSI